MAPLYRCLFKARLPIGSPGFVVPGRPPGLAAIREDGCTAHTLDNAGAKRIRFAEKPKSRKAEKP
jgi:hypothetical protein